MRSIGKQGFIFTLDVALGMIVVFAIVIITLFFVSRGSEVSLGEYQLQLVGGDIVRVMDEHGTFDSLSHDPIQDEMSILLPESYDMLLRVEGSFPEGNGTIEVGGELPANRFIISGQRAALTSNGTYLLITYFVWGRGQ